MKDTIYRQDAIDAMATWEWQEMYLPIHFKQLLEELPSAEPGIIRCKECANAPKCFGDVVMKTRSGGNLYCPLTFCSEGKRKDE